MENNKLSRRNIGLDCLKITAVYLVIILHVNGYTTLQLLS